MVDIIRRSGYRLTASLLVILAVGWCANGVFAEIDFGAPQADFSAPLVEVSTALSYNSVEAGGTYKAALIGTIKPGWHINSANPYKDWQIPAQFSFEPLTGFEVSDIEYPTGHDVAYLNEQISVYSDKVIVLFNVTVAGDITDGLYSIPVELNYQACDDSTCRAPETIKTKLDINIGSMGTPIHEDIFQTNETQTPSDKSTGSAGSETNELQQLVDQHGIWGYFLALGLAFVTGLLLSFSPCTYPMIPITVSIFAGQQRSLWRGFVMSLFYVGSMAVIYGLMGLVVSLVGGVFGAW